MHNMMWYGSHSMPSICSSSAAENLRYHVHKIIVENYLTEYGFYAHNLYTENEKKKWAKNIQTNNTRKQIPLQWATEIFTWNTLQRRKYTERSHLMFMPNSSQHAQEIHLLPYPSSQASQHALALLAACLSMCLSVSVSVCACAYSIINI